MIVSYSRNFIFIKTFKAAGTTIEAVLASGCGPNDIITKAEGDTYPGSDIPISGRVGLDKRHKNSRGFLTHMNAAKVRPKLDPGFWDNALKLTAERHPYEKAVSQAFFRLKRKPPNESFEQFLDGVIDKGQYADFPMWSIDGKPVIDEFIRQENLEADLSRVCTQLGFAMPDELPRLKSRMRTDRRPAREILSDEQKRKIYDTCREDFEILGYER